jgi:2-isopropylmalate synthase
VRIQETPDTSASHGTTQADRPQIFSGYGVNLDIIVAAAEAYLGALNKMLATQEDRARAQRDAHAAAFQRDHALYSVDLFGNSALGKAD